MRINDQKHLTISVPGLTDVLVVSALLMLLFRPGVVRAMRSHIKLRAEDGPHAASGISTI